MTNCCNSIMQLLTSVDFQDIFKMLCDTWTHGNAHKRRQKHSCKHMKTAMHVYTYPHKEAYSTNIHSVSQRNKRHSEDTVTVTNINSPLYTDFKRRIYTSWQEHPITHTCFLRKHTIQQAQTHTLTSTYILSLSRQTYVYVNYMQTVSDMSTQTHKPGLYLSLTNTLHTLHTRATRE